MTGCVPMQGVRCVLTDGASHAVDSSEMAFKIAAVQAFRQAYAIAGPTIMEPIMKVEITVPSEYQGENLGVLFGNTASCSSGSRA